MIDLIPDWSYPIQSRQSIFDEQELTALELAAKSAYKINEIIRFLASLGYPVDGFYDMMYARGINVKYPPIPYRGAKGDGVTDDTTAVQNLGNAFSQLYFPDGDYALHGFSINQNMRIECALNSRLILSSALTQKTLGVTRVEIEGMNIVSTEISSGTPADPSTAVFKAAVSLDNPALQFHWEKSSIRYQTQIQPNALGIAIQSIDRFYADRSEFYTGGIQMIDCNYFDISNNYFDTFDCNLNEQIHVQHNVKGVIRNNQMFNSYEDFIDCYAHGHETIIEGNRLDGGSTHYMEIKAIFRDAGIFGGSSTDLGNITKLIIRNNMFLNNKSQGSINFINAQAYDLRSAPVANDYPHFNKDFLYEGNFFEDTFVHSSVTLTSGRAALAFCGWDNVHIVNDTAKMLVGYGRPVNCAQLYGSPGPTGAPQRARNIIVNTAYYSGAVGVTFSEADNIMMSNVQIHKDALQTRTLDTGILLDNVTNVSLNNVSIMDDLYSILATNLVGDVKIVGCPSLGRLRFDKGNGVSMIGNTINGDIIFSQAGNTLNYVDYIGNRHDALIYGANITISGKVKVLNMQGNTIKCNAGYNVLVTSGTGDYDEVKSSGNILKNTLGAWHQSVAIVTSKFSSGDAII